jgi:hypothetical protein
MIADGFRRIALGLAGAVEQSHMGHPDFRVNGRIFATIHGDHKYGMVKLTPEQQAQCIREHPSIFAPESGAWGRAGCTSVRLDKADEDSVGEAMTLAWQNAMAGPSKQRSRTEQIKTEEPSKKQKRRRNG